MLDHYITFAISFSFWNKMKVSFFPGTFKFIITTKLISFGKKHIYLYFCASKN